MKTVHTILALLIALLVAGCATPNYTVTQTTVMSESFHRELASAKVVNVVFDGHMHTDETIRQNIISILAKRGVEQNPSNNDILISVKYPPPHKSTRRVVVPGGVGVNLASFCSPSGSLNPMSYTSVPDRVEEQTVWTTDVTITATDRSGASYSESIETHPAVSFEVCDAIVQQLLKEHKLWRLIGSSRK